MIYFDMEKREAHFGITLGLRRMKFSIKYAFTYFIFIHV